MRKSTVLLSAVAVAAVFAFVLSCSDNSTGPQGQKPAVPSGVTVTTVSTSSLRVTWNAAEGATFYNVYRANNPTGPFLPIERLFATIFTDTALTAATTYYYRVSAQNDHGESGISSPVSGTTGSCPMPATPTNVTAEAMSPVRIRITWDSIPAANFYRIFRRTDTNASWNPLDTTANRTYMNAGLSPDTRYEYRIAAVNNCGESEMSAMVWARTPDCPKPAAPTNVTATTRSATSIEISWDEVNTAVTYKIYRSTRSTGEYTPIGSTMGRSSTTFLDSGLEPTTIYYYRVTSESECDESAMSNYDLASTGCMTRPTEAPDSVWAETQSATSIRVSWRPVSGATQYNIYTATSRNGTFSYNANVPAPSTSINLIGRAPSTTYYFRITAVNDCGESELSGSIASVTTEDCNLPIPSRPTGVTATTQSSNTIQITWNAANGAATYDVYRSTERYSYFWTVGRRITGTSFTDTTGSPSTTYFYAVMPVNECGGSPENLDGDNIVSATTMCESPIPVNVTATARSSSSIEISWSAVPDAGSYSVYRATSATGTFTLLDRTSNNSFVNTGLSSLTTYFYRVTAKTALCADSRMSETVHAVTQ